jgi:DNA-binding MarR family transcriptional regulator
MLDVKLSSQAMSARDGRASGDRLDRLVSQWHAERPDLDVGVMAEVARALHVARLLGERLAAQAAEHGIQVGEGDVLFTLRRAGAPYRLSPTGLADSTLVTTGTMTNRLDRLEARGLVRRIPNPDDRRGVVVELSAEGRRLTDRLVTEHVANEHELLAILSERERDELTRILRKWLAGLEDA